MPADEQQQPTTPTHTVANPVTGVVGQPTQFNYANIPSEYQLVGYRFGVPIFQRPGEPAALQNVITLEGRNIGSQPTPEDYAAVQQQLSRQTPEAQAYYQSYASSPSQEIRLPTPSNNYAGETPATPTYTTSYLTTGGFSTMIDGKPAYGFMTYTQPPSRYDDTGTTTYRIIGDKPVTPQYSPYGPEGSKRHAEAVLGIQFASTTFGKTEQQLQTEKYAVQMQTEKEAAGKPFQALEDISQGGQNAIRFRPPGYTGSAIYGLEKSVAGGIGGIITLPKSIVETAAVERHAATEPEQYFGYQQQQIKTTEENLAATAIQDPLYTAGLLAGSWYLGKAFQTEATAIPKNPSIRLLPPGTPVLYPGATAPVPYQAVATRTLTSPFSETTGVVATKGITGEGVRFVSRGVYSEADGVVKVVSETKTTTPGLLGAKTVRSTQMSIIPKPTDVETIGRDVSSQVQPYMVSSPVGSKTLTGITRTGTFMSRPEGVFASNFPEAVVITTKGKTGLIPQIIGSGKEITSLKGGIGPLSQKGGIGEAVESVSYGDTAALFKKTQLKFTATPIQAAAGSQQAGVMAATRTTPASGGGRVMVGTITGTITAGKVAPKIVASSYAYPYAEDETTLYQFPKQPGFPLVVSRTMDGFVVPKITPAATTARLFVVGQPVGLTFRQFTPSATVSTQYTGQASVMRETTREAQIVQPVQAFRQIMPQVPITAQTQLTGQITRQVPAVTVPPFVPNFGFFPIVVPKGSGGGFSGGGSLLPPAVKAGRLLRFGRAPLATLGEKTMTEFRIGRPASSPSVAVSERYFKASAGQYVPTFEMLKTYKRGRKGKRR